MHQAKYQAIELLLYGLGGIFGFCYIYATIKAGKLAEIPETTLMFLGIASGGNVGNSYLNERQIVNKDIK